MSTLEARVLGQLQSMTLRLDDKIARDIWTGDNIYFNSGEPSPGIWVCQLICTLRKLGFIYVCKDGNPLSFSEEDDVEFEHVIGGAPGVFTFSRKPLQQQSSVEK